MQYKLSHTPLFKIVLPLSAGILLFNYWNVPLLKLLSLTGITFSIVVLQHFTIRSSFYKKLNSFIIYLLLLLTGGTLLTAEKLSSHKEHFSNYKAVWAKGIVSKPPEEKEKSYKTILSIEQVIDSNRKVRNTDGNLLIYIQKDSTLPKYETGDEVLLHLNYKPTENAKNPGQFDYRQYLSYKSIYHQQYIRNCDITLLHKHKKLFIKRWSNTISITIQSVLRKYIPGNENFALADGILLGHRAEIDEELYNAFAYTGIMHILSVSGLHVGIIYGMLLFFLSFIKDKNKKIKIAKFAFVFLFIWLFAFVTGLSPACVRAAILFSLLNFGRLTNENTNGINLLSGAAIIQLLIDPNALFDIGFQLSYLAMLGLFIFTNPIYSLYYHPNKLIDRTWKLWSASIAAQLFTVPLSIYYFGNFPTYFLLANIFAIPLSAVILWLSVFVVLFSFIPAIAALLGWFDSIAIQLFIKFTYLISNLPLGKLFNLYLSKTQLIILLVAVTSLSLFVILRKSTYLFACLSLFLSTILLSYASDIRQLKKSEIIVYAIRKNWAIGINQKDRQLLLSKDSIEQKDLQFSVKNSYRMFRIQEVLPITADTIHVTNLYYHNNLLYVYGKSFYFITRENSRKHFAPPLKTDFLVLSDNSYLDTAKLKTDFEFSQLLLSGDNDNRHLKIYKRLLTENQIPFRDISEKAFIIQ